MKFHFSHNILYLKSRLYVQSRFVKSRLYCTWTSLPTHKKSVTNTELPSNPMKEHLGLYLARLWLSDDWKVLFNSISILELNSLKLKWKEKRKKERKKDWSDRRMDGWMGWDYTHSQSNTTQKAVSFWSSWSCCCCWNWIMHKSLHSTCWVVFSEILLILSTWEKERKQEGTGFPLIETAILQFTRS